MSTTAIELRADTAHHLKERVCKLKSEVGLNMIEMGHLFKRLRDERYYADLGFESFNEFLGDPEVSMSRSTVYAFIEIWEVFIDRLKRDTAEIAGIDYSKLSKICPVVERDPDEWISKAATLSRTDLIEEVRAELGIEKEPKAEEPEVDVELTCSGRGYLEIVKGHSCIVCKKSPSDPHHFPITKGAGGARVGDWVIPLCRKCHEEAHHDPKEWMWTYRAKWGAWFYSLLFLNLPAELPEEVTDGMAEADVIEAELVTEPKALPAHEEPVEIPKPKKTHKGRAKVFKPAVLSPDDDPEAPLPFSKYGSRIGLSTLEDKGVEK